jgi:hypothetical protein
MMKIALKHTPFSPEDEGGFLDKMLSVILTFSKISLAP